MFAKLTSTAGVLLLAGLLQGCTTILDVEFTNLPPGPPLSGPLPGSPQGDSMQVEGSVKRSGPSVDLLYAPDVERPGTLVLITGGKPHDTSDYQLSFLARRPDLEGVPTLVITSLDVQGRRAFRLLLANAEFTLEHGGGTEVIGSFNPELAHQVFIRINLPSQRSWFVIQDVALGEGVEEGVKATFTADNKALLDKDFGELDRIRFEWVPLSSDVATHYWIREVKITKRN